MAPIRIRPAAPSDAPRLSEVKIAAWQATYRDIFPSEFLTGLQYPQQYWDRHLDGLLVAESEGTIGGYCSYGQADDEGWGEIRAIYVDPVVQRRGQGSALMRRAQEKLAFSGHSRALLWVIDRNRQARDFYERQGWSLGVPIRLEDIGGVQVTLVRYQISL